MSLPEQFGRYEILDVLGQGAMGLVYKAVDPVIERAVAIKVIQANPGLGEADLERMQARFEQEFRSAGALSHSNIVTIFDVGKEGDLYYIAMEYVEGKSLDAVLNAQGVLSFKEVSDLAAELSSALDYAHAQGVVHRDIKPANVLLTMEGCAKVTDFGLAKLDATTLTRTGALVGTPAYMSPEQVGGQQITGASDQFSLGILLYQALTGERPFTGDSPSTILYKIVHEHPLPPAQLNRGLPESVDHILGRCLHKSPNERYPTCVEMADALRQALGASPLETLAASVDPASLRGAPPLSSTPSTPAGPPSHGPSWSQAPAPGSAPSESQVPSQGHPPYSHSGSAPQARGVPSWILGMAIALPSLALLAVVAWLVASGRGPGTAAGTEEQPGSGAVRNEAGQSVGAEAPTAGGVGAAGDAQRGVDSEMGGEAEATVEEEQPAARPPTVLYTITSDPSGAQVRLDGESTDLVTPAEVTLATDVDHTVELILRGYEPTRTEIRMADRPADAIPDGLHMGLAPRATESTAVRNPDRNPSQPGGGRTATPSSRPEASEGIPEVLRQIIEAAEVPTGRVRIEAPFPVSLRIVPASQFQRLSQVLRDRLENATPEQRRRIMRGFMVAASQRHDMELPAGNWRISMMAPRLLMYHEEQVQLAPDRSVSLGSRIPTEFVSVTIRSDPEGARVRVDGLPPIPTPYNGRIVVGPHRFEFIWGAGGDNAVVSARIERGGQEIVGERRQERP